MRRLRPNIIALTVAAGVVAIFAMGFALWMGDANADNIISAIAGGYVGGVLALAGRIVEDPPPPAFPANELPALIAALRDAGVPLPETRDDHA